MRLEDALNQGLIEGVMSAEEPSSLMAKIAAAEAGYDEEVPTTLGGLLTKIAEDMESEHKGKKKKSGKMPPELLARLKGKQSDDDDDDDEDDD